MADVKNKEQLPTRSVRLAATVTVLLRFALIIAAIIAFFTGNWSTLLASIGTLILTFVPPFIASKMNVRLPLQFELFATAFIYAAMFLGEVGDYYQKFWWWDVALHTGSAFAFGFAGFLILYLLLERNKVKASPFLIALFSFSFALAIGALWEIFEFFMDSVFGTNMLKSGLRDTMWDLIVDSLGALTASTIGYIYLKYKVRDPFDTFVDWFLSENPRFAGKRRSPK